MEELSIYSLIVIIAVFIIICIAIIYVFFRFSNNSYSQKLKNVTSQINNSQISSHIFENTKNGIIVDNIDTIGGTVENVTDLKNKFEDISENISQYSLLYNDKIQKNNKDIIMIEQELPKDIKKQVDNIQILKNQRDIYNTNITNLNNTNSLQDMSIIDINLKNQSAKKKIDDIINTWTKYDNTSTTQFNDVNANYMKTNNFNNKIKDYKTKTEINDALNIVNTNIDDQNKVLQTYPGIYASAESMRNTNNDINTASENIQTQFSKLNTINSTFASRQDIINAQSTNNINNNHINTLLNNLNSSLTRLSTAITALNNTYQSNTSLTSIQNGNLTGNKLCLSDNTCITKTDFQRLILMP